MEAWPKVALACAIVAGALVIVSGLDVVFATGGLAFFGAPLALVAAALAIALGVRMERGGDGELALVVGTSVALTGILMWTVVAAFLVVPLMILLLIMMCMAPAPSTSTSCSCGSPGPCCVCPSVPSCGCGSGSCCGGGSGGGSCCGGSGSGGGSCCGSSAGAAPSVGGGGGGCCAAPVAAHRLAHHPDGPEYEQDVYRLRGARLCVGCFTTYPVFLLATVLLSFSRVGGGPLVVLGLALAALQGVSSAGLAKRRWMKVVVKSSLGVGCALVLRGALTSGWPRGAQLGVLLGVLLLAMASAIPRALRMRRAQISTSTP